MLQANGYNSLGAPSSGQAQQMQAPQEPHPQASAFQQANGHLHAPQTNPDLGSGFSSGHSSGDLAQIPSPPPSQVSCTLSCCAVCCCPVSCLTDAVGLCPAVLYSLSTCRFLHLVCLCSSTCAYPPPSSAGLVVLLHPHWHHVLSTLKFLESPWLVRLVTT